VLEGLAAAGLAWLWQRDRRLARLLGGGAAAAALCALAQNKFYPYHFQPYDQFLAVLAGYGVVGVGQRLPELVRLSQPGRGSAIAGAVLLALSPLLLLTTARADWRWLKYAMGGMDEVEYARAYDSSEFSETALRDGAAYIDAHTAPGSRIYVWGFDAVLYFLAKRPAASRFGLSYPVANVTEPGVAGMRSELIADLERTRPAIILVERHDANNLQPLGSAESLHNFPQLRALLAQDYVPQAEGDRFIAYARK
jgi:hypothetical protein